MVAATAPKRVTPFVRTPGSSMPAVQTFVEIDGSVVQTFVTSVMEKGSVRVPESPVVSQT